MELLDEWVDFGIGGYVRLEFLSLSLLHDGGPVGTGHRCSLLTLRWCDETGVTTDQLKVNEVGVVGVFLVARDQQQLTGTATAN